MSDLPVDVTIYRQNDGYRIERRNNGQDRYAGSIGGTWSQNPYPASPVLLPDGNIFTTHSVELGAFPTYLRDDYESSTMHQLLSPEGVVLDSVVIPHSYSTFTSTRMEDHTVWVWYERYDDVACAVFDTTGGVLTELDRSTPGQVGVDYGWNSSDAFPGEAVYLRELGLVVFVNAWGIGVFRGAEPLLTFPMMMDEVIGIAKSSPNTVIFFVAPDSSTINTWEVVVSDDGVSIDVQPASELGLTNGQAPLLEPRPFDPSLFSPWFGRVATVSPNDNEDVMFGTLLTAGGAYPDWRFYHEFFVFSNGATQAITLPLTISEEAGSYDFYRYTRAGLASYCNGKVVIFFSYWDEADSESVGNYPNYTTASYAESVFWSVEVDHRDAFHLRVAGGWVQVQSGDYGNNDLFHLMTGEGWLRDYRSADDRVDVSTPREPLHILGEDGAWHLVTMMTDQAT